MKFRTKLAIWVTLLISLVYGVGGTLLIYMTFQKSLDMERDKGLRSYQMLRSTLVLANNIGEQSDLDDVAVVLSQLAAQGGDWSALRLYINDTVLFENGTALPFDDALAERCTETLCSMKLLSHQGRKFQQITGTFHVGEEQLYLDTAYDISSIYTMRDTQLQVYRVLFIAVALLSAVVSYLLAYVLTRPLGHLSKTSRKIAQGSLHLRAQVRTGDEMQSLAEDFNSMADSLVEKIHELEDAMQRQESFMGSFAHELNTPMTSIIGYADLLRSCDMTEEERREAAGYVFSEGQRLESLSLKLLDLLVLRRQDFQLRAASPAQILEDIARLMERNKYNCPITLRYRAEEGRCLLEPDLCKSLLMNLIDNAIKSMDERGGTVSVHMEMLEDGCRCFIRDTGRGIPQEEITRITEAFYRVDKSRSRRQGGVGLGLALCQEIVRLHNGTMEFASEPGKGTTVTITLRGGAAV